MGERTKVSNWETTDTPSYEVKQRGGGELKKKKTFGRERVRLFGNPKTERC